MPIILKEFPGFQDDWEQHLRTYGSIGLSLDLGAFSSYTIKLLKKKTEHEQDELKKIFGHIEYLLLNGDQEVQNAAATCFQEDICNAIPEIPSANIITLLGKESKAYLKAWDEFTGVKTEGLW